MVNALIVVWRESLEAMLVIGVLLAWVARQQQPARLYRALWLGVAGGVALALVLAGLTFGAQSQLQGEALEAFQLGMVLFASGLITQMVIWMHRHGREMKVQLEVGASRAVTKSGALGVGSVAALAVAREGAETAVFLYGLIIERRGEDLAHMMLAAAGGFALAALTAWLVAGGARFMSYRSVFRVSEVLLLIVAASLLANGIERMIGLDWLPPLADAVWDTSALIGDGSGLGKVLADFAGYRARPSATLLLAYVAFWSFAVWRLRRAASR